MRTSKMKEESSRQKLAAENMTRAAQVNRQLQSGPIRSELRTIQEAIHLAAALNRQAKEAMEAKNPPLNHPKDFALVIAYMTPDLSVLFTRKFVPGEESKLQVELASHCCIMCGLIFGIRDHQRGGDWLIGAKPFLNTPLVLSALKERIDTEVIGIS